MSITLITKTFSSLKNPKLRLFFAGQSISLIGTWIQQTALSWLIYEMTGSRFLLGLIAALGAFPMLCISVFGGAIADRYKKRKILMITQTTSMCLAFTLALLLIFNKIQIWHIYYSTLFSGIVFAIDMPVRQTFFADLVERKDLNNAIALSSSMVNASRMIGPALAGIIMVKLGTPACFIINALSFLAVIYALNILNVDEIKVKKEPVSILESVKSGFSYVKQNKLILNLLMCNDGHGYFWHVLFSTASCAYKRHISSKRKRICNACFYKWNRIISRGLILSISWKQHKEKVFFEFWNIFILLNDYFNCYLQEFLAKSLSFTVCRFWNGVLFFLYNYAYTNQC